MSGRSAVAETMDGAGPVVGGRGRAARARARAGRPGAGRRAWTTLVERFGEVQAPLRRARRLRARGAGARDPRRPRLHAGDDGRRRRRALGRLEDARRARAHPAHAPRRACCSTSRPTTSTSSRSSGSRSSCKGYDGALLMTSHDREFMNRIVTKIVEIDGGELTTYSGNYDFYERERAIARRSSSRRSSSASRRCSPRRSRFIERFKARASHAAQVQSRVKKLDKIEKVEPPKRRKTVDFEFRAAAALRRGRREARRASRKRYGARADLRRARLPRPPRRALVRAWARTAPASRRCSRWSPARPRPTRAAVAVGGSVKMGYFAQHAMELLDAERTVLGTRSRTRSRSASVGLAARRSPAASASPATRSRSAAGCSRAARRRGW